MRTRDGKRIYQKTLEEYKDAARSFIGAKITGCNRNIDQARGNKRWSDAKTYIDELEFWDDLLTECVTAETLEDFEDQVTHIVEIYIFLYPD